VKIFHIAVVWIAAVSTGASAQISQVSYGSLTGTKFVDFDDIAGVGPPGINYDSVFSSNGVGFAERFVGQTVSPTGDNDQLGGATSGTLELQAGAAGRNLSVLTGMGTQVLAGLGPSGFPNDSARGEGAFAVLFPTNQSQFGFELFGGEGGTANIDFFRVDGSHIQSIVLGGLGLSTFYGFSRDGGTQDIRGISIWNTDSGGIGFDNLRFDDQPFGGAVPEPDSWALMIGGFGIVGTVMRRRRRGLAIVG